MNAILCSFSGSVADLKPKERANPIRVLAVLKSDPNVSTWDMDAGSPRYHLWKTIKILENRGWIISIERPYPWLRYELTEEGQRVVDCVTPDGVCQACGCKIGSDNVCACEKGEA